MSWETGYGDEDEDEDEDVGFSWERGALHLHKWSVSLTGRLLRRRRGRRGRPAGSWEMGCAEHAAAQLSLAALVIKRGCCG